jgi:hypothetical protein
MAFAAGTLLLACNEGSLQDVNHMPVILSVAFSPTGPFTGQDVIFRVEAIDEDNDGIRFFWASEAGSFDAVTGESVVWTAPDFGGVYEITCTASDRNTSVSTVVRVRVTAAQFAGDLEVESTPIGAEISLDGVNTEFLTPHTFSGLPVREYILSLFLPDRFLYPDTNAILMREGLDTTFTRTFVTDVKRSPTDGSTVLAPRLNDPAALVVFSANPLGVYQLFRNQVVTGTETSVQLISLTGYDGDAVYPVTRPATARVFFQAGLADTGVYVYEVGAGGGLATRVDLGVDARRPSFSVLSPTRMAFVSHDLDGGVYRTYVMETPNVTAVPPAVDTLVTRESALGRIEISVPNFSAEEDFLVYSVREPTGAEDIYLFDLALREERRLTTSGDCTWPVFGTGARSIFFENTDGSGIYGAALDRTRWRLGRAIPIAGDGSRQPSWARPSGEGSEPRVAFATASGVHIAGDFDDL